MKKKSTFYRLMPILVLVLIFSGVGMTAWAQTSTQNFGTGTGTHASTTGSTSFLPNPPSGTTWARSSSSTPTPVIEMATASNPLGTTGTYIRAVASSSTSVSKFSPMVGYTGGTEFYTSFKILFGDSSAGASATSGDWSFFQGAGAMYSNVNGFASAEVFTGLQFTFGAGGAIALAYRVTSPDRWSGTLTTLSSATAYKIEIVGNNKTSGTINYVYNGVSQTVAVQKFDLYINGVQVGDDLAVSALPAGTAINSTTFIGTSSTAGVANIFVDDVVVYNSVPSSIEGTPTWTGGTSTVWTEPSNWSGGVPTTTSDVVIGTGTYQPTIASDVTIQSLTINATTILTVGAGKVLNDTGAIRNAGNLILQSSASGTASLLSATSAGNVTQQRYLSSNQRGWRLLSNPLSTTTFSTIETPSNITLGANFTGEYLPASNTWTSSDATAVMETQKAYKVFIIGLSGESPNYSSGISNVTISINGTAANTAPSAISTGMNQYYLVANPYTAPVSVASILAASTGLSNSVSYYNPTKSSTDVKVKAGGYDVVTVSGAAGSATDVVIPPMGAIFVMASSAGNINIPKTAIYTGTVSGGSYNQKVAQAKVITPDALILDVSSNGVDYDTLQLQFKEAGTAGSNIDFGKLPNTFLDFYSIDNGNNRAISELELKEQTIPLGITSTLENTFTLKVAENTIPTAYNAVLVDNVLNTTTVLTPGTSYNFAIDSAPASQGNARFAINLKSSAALSVKANDLDAKIQLYPNPAHNQFNILNAQSQNDGASTIEISNLNGQLIRSQKSNPGTSTTIQTNGWAEGVYILKVTNNGIQTTKKLIIQ